MISPIMLRRGDPPGGATLTEGLLKGELLWLFHDARLKGGYCILVAPR